MRNFDPSLLDKPRLVALNKIDALSPDFPRDEIVLAYEQAGWRVFAVSAQAGAGLSPLRQAIWKFFVKDEDIIGKVFCRVRPTHQLMSGIGGQCPPYISG